MNHDKNQQKGQMNQKDIHNQNQQRPQGGQQGGQGGQGQRQGGYNPNQDPHRNK